MKSGEACPPTFCIDPAADGSARGCRMLGQVGLSVEQAALLDRRNRTIDYLSNDRRIPGFVNTAGAVTRLVANKKMGNLLLSGEVGLATEDGRGLGWANKAGMWRGNNLLNAHGLRIMAGVRTGIKELSSAVDIDFRDIVERTYPFWEDIGVRDQGADEISALMAVPTHDDAKFVVERLASQFSVEQAIRDDQRRVLPLIGTFVYSHVTDVMEPLSMRQISRLSETEREAHIQRGVDTMFARNGTLMTDELKWAQYDEMYRLAVTGTPEERFLPHMHTKTLGKDTIMTMFTERCLPHFATHGTAMLLEHGPEHPTL